MNLSLGNLGDLEGLRLLRSMGMLRACVDLELADELAREAILGQHSPHSALNGLARIVGQKFAIGNLTKTARITGVACGHLGASLIAGQRDFLGVDDDDEVTRVDMTGKLGLVLPAKQICDLHGKATENDVLSVDDVPIPGDLPRLRAIGGHELDHLPYTQTIFVALGHSNKRPSTRNVCQLYLRIPLSVKERHGFFRVIHRFVAPENVIPNSDESDPACTEFLHSLSMRRILLILASAVLATFCVGPQSAYGAPARPVAPLMGVVTRGFDPPEQVWGAGHRGVDIGGAVGDEVRAAVGGTVRFAGWVGGKPVVSISHGETFTTYEPVTALVSIGQWVDTGQVIGILQAGHPCETSACLHWGLRHGERYLNPLSLLGSRVRLLSAEAMDDVRAAAQKLMTQFSGQVSAAGLSTPASGPLTSPYGLRPDPFTGEWVFHDGLDIGAACGSPLVAAAAGVVVEVSWDSMSGNRLLIDHGELNGHRMRTGYNHAQGYVVEVGQQVVIGQVIGSVGTTGYSTGCHLHFQVWRDGLITNPLPLIP